jgi:hypothetical protein
MEAGQSESPLVVPKIAIARRRRRPGSEREQRSRHGGADDQTMQTQDILEREIAGSVSPG